MVMPVKCRKILGAVIFCLLLVGAVVFWSQRSAAGYTRLNIREKETGRVILSSLLRDCENAVIQWRNSLFALDVTETFQLKSGFLVLESVTFADPRGLPPTQVRPSDVDDLYQTGGPFTASGLGRPFSRVVYRVSEIGNPTLKIRDRTVNFKNEVGFGGGVVLATAVPSRFEVLTDLH